MSEPIQPTGPNPAQAAADALPGVKPGQTRSTDETRPAFRVLRERLQEQALSLEAKSKEVEDSQELSGAVDEARASLDEALSLGDRLLEAYREAQHKDAAEATSGEDGP